MMLTFVVVSQRNLIGSYTGYLAWSERETCVCLILLQRIPLSGRDEAWPLGLIFADFCDTFTASIGTMPIHILTCNHPKSTHKVTLPVQTVH